MRDITGQTFGRLLAIEVHHSINHKRFWSCKCTCGNSAIIRQDQLTIGKTKSCGCLSQEMQKANLKIGQQCKPHRVCAEKVDKRRQIRNPLKHEYPRLYRIWGSMKSRCYYPKNKCYHYYGGRGITICDDWRNSFSSFANWALSHGYSDSLSIDRIDVNGNYCPDNCRWATMQEQQSNKRKSPSRKT